MGKSKLEGYGSSTFSIKLTEEVGFVQSKVDECVFYKGKTIYALLTIQSSLVQTRTKSMTSSAT
jgi:hypothetical protein